jgi:hypothetical protein
VLPPHVRATWPGGERDVAVRVASMRGRALAHARVPAAHFVSYDARRRVTCVVGLCASEARLRESPAHRAHDD